MNLKRQIAVTNKLQACAVLVSHWLTLAMKSVLVLCVAGVALTIFAAVFARYLLHTSLFGYDEITFLFATWLYFIGAVYTQYKEGHVRSELLEHLLRSQRQLAVLRVVTQAICLGTGIFFSYYALIFVKWNILTGEVTPRLLLPKTIITSAIFVSLILMTVLVFISVVKSIRLLRESS